MLMINIALPEVFLLAALCLVLMLDSFTNPRDSRVVTYLVAQASLLTTALLVYSRGAGFGLERMYIADEMAIVLKISILILASLSFAYARKYLRDQAIWRGEFFVLCMTAVLGMMIMISGYHLLVLYLGLELLALSMYALVAIQRDDVRANEAAMKYFVLGAIASGLLLYGISILYGLTGGLGIDHLSDYFAGQAALHTHIPLLFALVFIVAGLAFKFGAVPFHMWLPDVYQGSPTAVTLFLGSLPKIAAFALLVRILGEGLESAHSAWSQLLLVLGLLSVVFGNLVAIAQTNLKRMFAYSTVAHMGFILMGALTATHDGYSAAMFYTLIYALMSAGGFAILIMLGRHGFDAQQLSDLKGLNDRSPWIAFMMLLILFSMAGIPPLVGFYAKLAIIQAVVGANWVWAAVIMVLMSVVGAFYYLRAIKMMYFEAPDDQHALEADPDFYFLISVNGLLMLVLGLFPGVLMEICSNALTGSQL